LRRAYSVDEILKSVKAKLLQDSSIAGGAWLARTA
jgi:hypothetical protein